MCVRARERNRCRFLSFLFLWFFFLIFRRFAIQSVQIYSTFLKTVYLNILTMSSLWCATHNNSISVFNPDFRQIFFLKKQNRLSKFLNCLNIFHFREENWKEWSSFEKFVFASCKKLNFKSVNICGNLFYLSSVFVSKRIIVWIVVHPHTRPSNFLAMHKAKKYRNCKWLLHLLNISKQKWNKQHHLFVQENLKSKYYVHSFSGVE